MPFENRFARSFTALSIEREAPAASGVYGISNSRHWIYIAESENIRASLLEQLANFSGGISNESPAGFTFELSLSYNRIARRDRLIAELAPLQNHETAATPRRGARGSPGD